MKTFACKDAGMECDFIASAETVDEVMSKAMEHARAAHPEKLEEMTKSMTEDEVKATMMALVKEA